MYIYYNQILYDLNYITFQRITQYFRSWWIL